MTRLFPKDVAAAFRAVFVGSTPSLDVPGGMWYGLVSPTASVPYATIAVVEGEKETDSKGIVSTFRVTISLYSDAGVSDGGSILASVAALYDGPAATANLVISGHQVLRCRSETPEAEIEDQRRGSADVCAGRVSFRFVVNSPKEA